MLQEQNGTETLELDVVGAGVADAGCESTEQRENAGERGSLVVI
jgi:hypothetical protein